MSMNLLTNAWDVIVWFFWVYVFIAYLFALVLVLADIFRDHSLNGGLKALWIFCLIFVPLLTVLVYVITRGKGMSERNSRETGTVPEPTDYTPRWGTAPSSSDEISRAQSLLSAGVITEEEFATLKAKALV